MWRKLICFLKISDFWRDVCDYCALKLGKTLTGIALIWLLLVWNELKVIGGVYDAELMTEQTSEFLRKFTEIQFQSDAFNSQLNT